MQGGWSTKPRTSESSFLVPIIAELEDKLADAHRYRALAFASKQDALAEYYYGRITAYTETLERLKRIPQ